MNPYEQDRVLQTYLLFHYGSREHILAGSPLEAELARLPDAFFRFPAAVVADLFDHRGTPVPRALDLGCAVGRSAFELSKHALEVVGIDYSRTFVEAAAALGTGRTLAFHRYGEAHLGDTLLAQVPDGAEPVRVRFEVGDALALRPDLGRFDWVLAANLLCRLSEPRLLLERLPDLVKPGGQLVMATPATWLEEFTPLSGQPPGPTLDFLRDTLGDHFDLQGVVELPFLIREHGRKFQISTSQASRWVRRGA